MVCEQTPALQKVWFNVPKTKRRKTPTTHTKSLQVSIRNKLKVYGTVNNAKRFQEVQKEFGTFDKYIWQFTGNKVINNKYKTHKNIQPFTKESDAMSADLYKRGFKFVGSTICYAYMQAAGMVNDHMVGCHRHGDC